MCEEGYLRSSSRSRYLSASVRLRVRGEKRNYSSQKAIVCMERLAGIEEGSRAMYVIGQPVILQRIDILFRHLFNRQPHCPLPASWSP
jgi:hypothetical protein